MNSKTFESIKEKIETLKREKAKSEGAIEAIEDSWKKDYGISSIEEATKLHEELNEKLATYEDEMGELENELKGLTNWALI